MNSLKTPLSSRTFWTIWISGLVIWLVAMFITTGWDLELSQTLADPENLFGKVVAWGGEWPSWLLVVFCVTTIVLARRPTDSRFKVLVPLALSVVLLAVIEPLLITQTLKFFWGRVRFRNLGADFSGFTPFYIPAGPGAGKSFPSGHVAMACVSLAVAFFVTRAHGYKAAILAWILVLGYCLAVAWGRILAGAHYLTDCMFSLGLSLLLAAWLVRVICIKREPPS
jgi:membrane-associated phospholipid phosphatase